MSKHGDTPPLSQLEVSSKCSSASTRRPSVSMAAAKARANAEAASTRAEYGKRQIDMEVERARIEMEKTRLAAMINALMQEGEAKAALAAARVFEAAVLDQTESDESPEVPATIATAASRTQEYVNTHFHNETNMEDETKPDKEQKWDINDTIKVDPSGPTAMSNACEYTPSCQPIRHPKPSPFHFPSYNGACNVSSPSLRQQTDVSDLAVLLSRRDLLTAGLTVFDNRPETYVAWKSMFHNATADLNLKCCEELDLLTKWLSGESLQHALRIRAVHVSNPAAGLERLWQRLDRNYGSPEAIEASLFGRLESFPRVGHKDSHLLQELADLLRELEAAKDEGYLPGLSFLDTSRGINPIVEKLPGGLQEAWVKEGSRYKRDHKAHYPPFSYFVQFVNNYAEMRTDPSFILQNCGSTHMRAERTLVRQTRFKVPVTTNKTQVGPANNEPNQIPQAPQ
ncbi:uncharacterized protein LOC130513013 [Takifugu flavidus]|uniref:uncharacterized protein LOC130513013 n=1 Tax=Takifugu flavidus TaxID=433684 RepID=UPI002544ABEA|nr:uncharacterized protein LOC130513013 [Takifugu flavidus]